MANLSEYRKAQKTFGILFLVSSMSLIMAVLMASSRFQSSPETISTLTNTTSNSIPVLPVPAAANRIIPDKSSSNPRAIKTPGMRENTTATPNASNKKPNISSAANSPNLKTPITRQGGDDIYVPQHPSKINGTQISPTPAPTVNYINLQTPSQTTEFVPTFLIVTGGLSLFSTITTMIGFLTTTVFALRREKREKESFRIENERKELELERLKIDLYKNKQVITSELKICAVCKRTYSDNSLSFCLDDGSVLSAPYNSDEFSANSSDKTIILKDESTTEILEPKTLIDNRN